MQAIGVTSTVVSGGCTLYNLTTRDDECLFCVDYYTPFAANRTCVIFHFEGLLVGIVGVF